jgi:2-polyprenyl-3-methyl-5-hydroxy-6-metoxy-1,4-benzoquinol methylase
MMSLKQLAPLDPRIPEWDRSRLVARSCPLCADEGRPRFRRPDALEVRSCGSCGLWFVSPAPSESALARFYLSYATSHRGSPSDLIVPDPLLLTPDDSLVLTELRSAIDLKGRRLLDVGCGTGAFLELAARVGANCVGVDLDADSCRLARLRPGGQ